MRVILRRATLIFALLAGLAGCADNGGESSIVGPGLETGSGRVYPLEELFLPANDGVQVSALFGPTNLTQPRPVVILIHDLSDAKEAWLNDTSLLLGLLERGYLVVAIDLRGYGQTALPDGRQVPLLDDLERSFLDVHAVLDWLQGLPGADGERVGLIGHGSGGNIAYVSMGVFPQRIKTAVSLSPGLWERDSLQPVVIGSGLDPFGPRSILFMAGGQDVLSGGDVVLSYADFARALAAGTGDPTSVLVYPNSADHGLDLLNNVPEAVDSIFLWLENNL
jgi:pimeloyl-ACP methyl ester carboxylesterase